MSDDFDRFFEEIRRPAATSFVRGDASRVVALSAQRGPVTLFDPDGGLSEGADEINRVNARAAARFGSRSHTELDVKDRCTSGDLAFWTGYQDAEIETGGKLRSMHLRITEVYRRMDGEWRLVHRHASRASESQR